MGGPLTVARVLLIAHPCRQRELSPWLRVEGEPVDYVLELLAPAEIELYDEFGSDVVVIDGGSFVEPRERTRILGHVGRRRHEFATSIYIISRLPLEKEIAEAWRWVDDLIDPGWAFSERLRRRVQTLALAPWRRSRALRLRAELTADPKLRVLGREEQPSECDESTRSRTGTMRRLDRAMPFVLAEQAWSAGGDAPKLVAAAFHEGRRVGVTSVQERAAHFARGLEVELAEGLRTLSPEVVEQLEDAARSDASFNSPVVAARHAAACGLLEVVRGGFESLANEELAGIERHRARGQ